MSKLLGGGGSPCRRAVPPLQDAPPGEVIRRLSRIPTSGRGDLQGRLFEVKERFTILRRLGVESECLSHQGRRVDSSLLFEIGALTTNRLIALLQALPAGRMTRRDFFDQMHSEMEASREKDAPLWARTRALQSLAAAQSKIDRLERSIPRVTAEDELDTVRRCAVGCAVSIALFLEAWWRRPERGQDV